MNQNTNTSPPGYPQNHYGYPSFSDFQDEKPINWRKYLFLFLHNWYWFLITLGIALGIAFFKIRYAIPHYQATSKLIIEQEENSQDMVSQMRAMRYWRRQSDLANETAKIKSFTTIKRAVDSVHQEIFWTAHGRIRVRPLYENHRYNITILYDSIDWYKNQEWFIDYIDDSTYRFYREESIDTILPLDKIVSINSWRFSNTLVRNFGYNTYSFVVNDPVALSKKYKQKLKVESDEEKGSTITLYSEGPVGEREVDFLNTLSYIYILSELERKQTIAENTSRFIDGQINVILDSLKRAENQLLTFRLSNNVINLSREGEIAYERLKTFNEQRTSLKLQENYYDYLKKYIEERNDPHTIIAPTLTEEGDRLLISAVQNLQELYKEREILQLSVHENNPGLTSINDRISGIRARIIEIVKGLIENNHLTQEQIQTEEQAIIIQLNTLPINEQQLLNIKRKYDLYNNFYTFLLEKRAEAGIQKASTISNARILDPARHDHLIQIGSDKKVILLIAILMSILVPGIVFLLRDLLDNRIREREDIINRTNIPIIGVIGHATNTKALLAKEYSTSAFTESLRRIRTNLAFALREKEQKVIMITSSVSGEGKTFSAANLAAIIAMNGRRVLLLGCDMRKPTLHRVFNISNESGITNYIIGEKSLEEIITPTYVENLFVIPAGPVPPNPAELIETREMKFLFQQAKKDYDYIIIDTPPIALVADALSLASYADLTLYLIRQNHSHRGVIEVVNSMRDEEKLPKTYLLINDINPSKSFGMNYYYGYEKGYSYGYYDSNYSSAYRKEK
jgi:tyrosine-protein kinase Etk/Wzc